MLYQEQLSLFQDKDYREAYLETQVCAGIAYQIQAMRQKDGSSQKDFAEKIGKPQSVVSRLENTEYGKVSVQTLLDVACSLNVALIVKFASYPRFLQEYEIVSPEALAVETIEESVARRHTSWLNNDVLAGLFVKTWPVPTNYDKVWSLLATPVTIDQQGSPAT